MAEEPVVKVVQSWLDRPARKGLTPLKMAEQPSQGDLNRPRYERAHAVIRAHSDLLEPAGQPGLLRVPVRLAPEAADYLCGIEGQQHIAVVVLPDSRMASAAFYGLDTPPATAERRIKA